MSFVHLHVHSQYSILDSSLKIADLIEKSKNLNFPAVALTDHGNLFGGMDFYFSALKAGLKPILGCEFYITSGSRLEKTKESARDLFHITVLSKNLEGYKSLCQLITKSYVEGFYYKPRIDFELLQKYAEGLIVLSGCKRAEIPSAILRDDLDQAQNIIKKYQSVFKDDFYLEIQNHGLDRERKIMDQLRNFSRDFNIKLVATNNVHYLKPNDSLAHDVLLCLQTQRNMEDPNRLKFENNQFYLKSRQEMSDLFEKEELDTTLEIADKVNLKLQLTNEKGHTIYHLPDFETKEPIDEYFRNFCKKGLLKRLEENPQIDEKEYPKYHARLHDEVEMIIKTGFVGYFLVVSDFVSYAKSQQISVGPGRGSGAGSLVAWVLVITDLDPIYYDLLFERFINPERVSLPDFDIDFCMDRRNEVIDYVSKRYGGENVCQIITFGKLLARGVLRDVGRVYAIPYAEMDAVAKLIPEELGITLSEAFEKEPELKKIDENDKRLSKVFETALSLEGSIKNVGKHAAGLIITNRPLVEYLPLYVGKEGELTTQFDKDFSEKIGLVKFDFLGLKTLTHIQRAENLIKKKIKDFDIRFINHFDDKTFEMIAKGDCHGIFQLESGGMADLCIKIKPKSIKDISILSALYRPGPIEAGMVDDFIDRRNGVKKVEYLFDVLKDVLEETLGVIVYQEQVMRIARIVSGYSLGQADLLRRAMGKKKAEEMAAQREMFVKGGEKSGFDSKKVASLFDLLEKFASYGFNKSHTCAYSVISYQTAFLKAHYPNEFFATLLSTELDNPDKLGKYLKDTEEHGIKILPPDVNRSEENFAVDEMGNILFGLSGVKGVGSKASVAIVEERKENGPYKDIFDFVCRLPTNLVNKKTLESLILVGGFRNISKINTNTLLNNLDIISLFGQNAYEHKASGQVSLFDTVSEVSTPSLRPYEELSKDDLLKVEKELVGFYISGHPLDDYAGVLRDISNLNFENFDVEKEKNRRLPKDQRGRKERIQYQVGGLVSGVRNILTKKNDKMATFELETLGGVFNVVAFPKAYEKIADFIRVGERLLCTMEIDDSEDSPKLICNNCKPLSEYSIPPSHRILLETDINEVTELFIESIKKLCSENPGTHCLTIGVKSEDGKVYFNLPEKINASGKISLELSSLVRGKYRVLSPADFAEIHHP